MSYIRNDGNIHRMSRIVGGRVDRDNQLYPRSMGLEHLQEGHVRYSPLGRLA